MLAKKEKQNKYKKASLCVGAKRGTKGSRVVTNMQPFSARAKQ
jgi:hypothetical protein